MQRTTSDLRDLAESLVSLSGAASLFGIRQLGRLLDVRSPIRASEDVVRRLDSVTRTVTDQLEGPLWTAFDRTDVLQRSIVDFLFDLTTLNAPGILAFGGPVLEPLATALNPLVAAIDRAIPGIDAEVRWLELKNKIEIYFLVENAATRLQISPVERTPLSDLVERAYALGPFLSLWAVEGLGHVYGDQAQRETPVPRGLLTGPESDASRPGALLMLHAGIGLAFAQKLLEPLSVQNAGDSLRQVVSRFSELCRENSRPGYVGAAYESLGLVAQTFHQGLVADIDRELQQSANDLLGYFWHGVGRAIYFSTRNFLPCAEIDWEGAPQIAPHETGRLNITAGLAWAVTLVNMRQPVIVERMLRRHGDVLSRTSAFANGVESSIVMRSDTTPGADLIGSLCSYQPGPLTGRTADPWDRLIGEPCHRAVSRAWPALVQAGRLDSVFHYRPPNDRPGQR